MFFLYVTLRSNYYGGINNIALIKCPECGREGVSEYAEACPSCGFVVRQYVQLVKEEQEKREKEEKERIEREEWKRETQKREEEERKRKKLQRRKNYNQKMAEINQDLQLKLEEIDAQKPLDHKPNISESISKGEYLFCTGMALTFGLLSFVLFTSKDVETQIIGGGLFLLLFIIFIWFILNALFSDLEKYNLKVNDYEHQHNDWEGYKEKKKKVAIQSAEILRADLTIKYQSGKDF